MSEPTRRIETGPTQFGTDWPGLFIRGDDCFRFATALEDYLRRHPHEDKDITGVVHVNVLKGLMEMLRSTDVRRHVKPQMLKDFEKCVKPAKKGKTPA